MMVPTGIGDESILQCAAESGSKGVFVTVLAALAEQLAREEASTRFFSRCSMATRINYLG